LQVFSKHYIISVEEAIARAAKKHEKKISASFEDIVSRGRASSKKGPPELLTATPPSSAETLALASPASFQDVVATKADVSAAASVGFDFGSLADGIAVPSPLSAAVHKAYQRRASREAITSDLDGLHGTQFNNAGKTE
jgi:hypothetical protein